MTCTLDLYTYYLIRLTGGASATGLSRLFGGVVSHDQVARWLHASYLDLERAWAHAKPLIHQAEQQRPATEFAVLIVDDSILKKILTDPSALDCTHLGLSQGRFVKGLNFVSLLYQAGALALTIDIELIEKNKANSDAKIQKTKAKRKYAQNEYLRAMLRKAQQQGAHCYRLADRWYASAENLNAVLALGYDFVMAFKSSRTVARNVAYRQQGQFQTLATLFFPNEQPLSVWLRAVQPTVLVARQFSINKDGSQGVLYRVSSDTGLDRPQPRPFTKDSGKSKNKLNYASKMRPWANHPQKRPISRPTISLLPS